MTTSRELIVRYVQQESEKVLRRIVRDTIREVRTNQRNNYKGDSKTKKAVRLNVWECIRNTLGTKFESGRHMFLCSCEGGDASVLSGLGLDYDSMIAVDHDPKSVTSFHNKFPNVEVHKSDISEALLDHDDLSSIYLDFTSQVSDSSLKHVYNATKALNPNGVIACTFSVGREKELNLNDNDNACLTRVRIFESYLKKRLGFKPNTLAYFSYKSDSDSRYGSLMLVIVFQVKPQKLKNTPFHKIDIYDFYRNIERLMHHQNLCSLLNSNETQVGIWCKRVREYPPSPRRSDFIVRMR